MNTNVSIIKVDIGTHNNWRIIEDYMENKLISNKNIIFITFCEMYFYKGGKSLKQDWVGIIHDPEDAQLYYKNKNIINNTNFKQSLPYCKGLFSMSHNLKKWIIQKIKPSFFVSVLHHPISNKNLMEFQMEEYKKNKCIIQIGNWLRKTYSICKLNTNVNKEILPWTKRTQKEMQYFLNKDNVILTELEQNSVLKTPRISDSDYNKIFNNKIIFLNLYSSTANNVIMECIKANNPIIINRLESIESYLGKEYPLFYDNLSEVTSFLENDDLILKAVNYLKNLDKSKFSIQMMINTINNKL
tara:strand:+ start:386 stop:1285 length:900 start_codon:yes stop_codon:yes gene_type:complete